MELQNLFDKKFKRKNFFITLSAAAAGYVAGRSILFRLFGSRRDIKTAESGKIKIRLNSQAVSRGKMPSGKTKIGDTNV